jgi:hypothetical protein
VEVLTKKNTLGYESEAKLKNTIETRIKCGVTYCGPEAW